MRVAFVPDLMDRSRLNGIPDLMLVNSPAAVEAIAGLGPGDVVAFDLSRPASLETAARVARAGAKVIGFASHVDSETMRAANAAGVTAMARSAFFGSAAELFA